MNLPSTMPELMRGRWPFMLALFFVLLPIGAGPQGTADGSGLRQAALGALFIAAAFAVVRFPARWALLRRGVPLSLVAVLLYIALSAIWSPEPYVSFKRVVQVYGVALLGAALLVGGGGRFEVQRVAAPVLLVGMLLAVVFTAAFPGFAFAENGLRAFLPTKNNFGQFAGLCILISVGLLSLDQRRRAVWWSLALVGLVGLVLSRSATTAVALAAVGVFYLMVLVGRRIDSSWRQALLVAVMLSLVCTLVVVVVYGLPTAYEINRALLSVSGRDVTLTGRTYLWELMMRQVSHHPFFGTGYGGFWLGLEGESGQVAYLVKWGYPGQAHNGYLDLLNELGVVGCTLVAWFIGDHAVNVVRLSRTDPRRGHFHGALLIAVLVLNLAEAALLRTTHFWWIVLMASIIEVRFRVYSGAALPLAAPSAPVRGVLA